MGDTKFNFFQDHSLNYLEMARATCFVVMPYGKKPVPGTNDRFDFDKVYRVIMQPAIREAGFEPQRADESASSGLIHSEMFTDLRDQPVVLVDLSLHNPNVFYELGIRHVMAQRGTVLICESSTHLPFDIGLSRVIKYEYDGKAFDYEEAERVKPLLTSALREATKQPDSPVHAMLDRVLQEATAEVELGLDARVANAESIEVLRQYARVIAGTWPKNSNINRLRDNHAGSRLGVLALAEFCSGRRPLPKDAERVASLLRFYSQYEQSIHLFRQLDREKQLSSWLYMQFGSSISEEDKSLAGAEKGLKMQIKGLGMATRDYKAEATDKARWNYAYCLHHVGSMHEWIWRCGDRTDMEHLNKAISYLSESSSVAFDPLPTWLNFVLRNHLKLLYLLRARDGRRDRRDDEGHLDTIMRLKAPTNAKSAVQSSVGWYKVVAHVERGNEDAGRREALKQLQRDQRLASSDKTFNRAQLYYLTRRFMRDNAEYQRYPRLWEPIAQWLKDASTSQLED
jgi:hypothetical protein